MTMPASRPVLLETTAVNSLLSFYSTKLLVLLAICALISTTTCLANAKSCTTPGDCGRDGKEDGKQCCNGLCTQNSSCLDQNCIMNVNCATSEVCCSNKCVDGFNCLGEACTFDDDCQWDESCCFGSCRKNNECTNLTIMLIIYISAFVLFIIVICPFVYKKLTSGNQWLSSPDSSSRITSATNSSNLYPDIPRESPSHPTLHTFFARENGNPLTICSETTEKKSRGVNITITSYGSISKINQP